MNMNSILNREIQDGIAIKKLRQDRNGKDYLILELENGESIYVFENYKLPKTKWEELKEGEKYNFIVKESNISSNILVEYESLGKSEDSIWGM